MSDEVFAHNLALNFFYINLKATLLKLFHKFHHLPSAAEHWSAGKMAEKGSDARSYNLFPSYPVVCFEKKEMESEEKKERRPKKQMDPSPS